MKQMKFLVAILAIGLVVVGSAFTTKKPAFSEPFGILQEVGPSSQDPTNYTKYILVREADVEEVGCGIGEQNCKMLINFNVGTSYGTHDLIVLDATNAPEILYDVKNTSRAFTGEGQAVWE